MQIVLEGGSIDNPVTLILVFYNSFFIYTTYSPFALSLPLEVASMSILCLWDIQLTFDRNGVGTYGAYHHKSELKCCNRVQFVFKLPKFAEVSAILEPANSTPTDYSVTT